MILPPTGLEDRAKSKIHSFHFFNMSLNFRPQLKHLLADDWMTHADERFPPDQSAAFADTHVRPVKEHATRPPAMTTPTNGAARHGGAWREGDTVP